MGKARKTRQFAKVKRIISARDERSQKRDTKPPATEKDLRHIPQVASSLFFEHNKALGPPYHVLLDTNFINKSIQNKLEILPAMMDCLYARCTVYVTECVLGELEKLGPAYRLALKMARNPLFERLPCMHKGTYADDCIINRINQHPCYIVATNDRDLKQRVRKVPGIPILYVARRRYAIERLPEAPSAFV